MTASHAPLIYLTSRPTLLDLFLTVQEFSRDDDEAVAVVASLLESGQVKLSEVDGDGRPLASGGSDDRAPV